MPLALLIALALAGCVESTWDDVPSAPVHAEGGGEAWAGEVSRFVGAWSVTMEQAGCPRPFELADDGHPIVLVEVSDWDHGDNIAGMTFGEDVFGAVGHVEVKGDFATGHGAVLLHELGHAMGLEHVDQGLPSIMVPAPLEARIHPADIAAAACALGCGPC